MRRLMLHSISDTPGRYSISPEIFRLITRSPEGLCYLFDDGYMDIFTHLKGASESVLENTYVFPVASRIGKTNDWDSGGELAGKALLGWEEISRLAGHRVKIGSHGMNHIKLTDLDTKSLKAEVVDSKKLLEDRLEIEVDGFSYPFGLFNAEVIDAVREAGYKWAVTTSPSLWEGFGNPYRMRRISIYGTYGRLGIMARTSGLYDIRALWDLPALCVEKLSLMVRAWR